MTIQDLLTLSGYWFLFSLAVVGIISGVIYRLAYSKGWANCEQKTLNGKYL